MSLILLDTDVASFIFKGSSYALPYQPLIEGNQIVLSFMTVAELFQWTELRQWGDRRRAQLTEYLYGYIIIPTDIQLCQRWAEVRAQRQRIGKPIAAQDAWVAATALRHDIPLITHNRKDFADIPNLRCLHPDISQD